MVDFGVVLVDFAVVVDVLNKALQKNITVVVFIDTLISLVVSTIEQQKN